MTQRVSGQDAYVLHTRPFRETSLLLDLLTPDHGRICGVCRGVRNARRAAAVRPFVRYSACWSGRGEVLNVHTLEPQRQLALRESRRLLCGLYLNELVIKLSARGNPSGSLFALYAETLHTLAGPGALEPILRRFEAELLRFLGYEIRIDECDALGQGISHDTHYRYEPESGLLRPGGADPGSVSGRALLAIRDAEYARDDTAMDMKLFFRKVLDHHLQGKALYARKIMHHLPRG
jgi:DNA repair protein RecO (recombination protein O)